MATRRKTTATAPAPEPVEDEFEELEDDGLEEVDETEPVAEEKPKPKTKRKPPQVEAPEFSSAWLAEHVTEVTGETFDARGIRMLLRKLMADGKLDRELGGARYSFSGPADPTVKAVVLMIQDGTAKALKQEGLEKVKELGKAKLAEKRAAKAAAEAKRAAEADEMEEEEEEVPAPPVKRRSASKATAAPAKATPSTRRRAPAAS